MPIHSPSKGRPWLNIDPRTPISVEVEKTFADILPRTALAALASFDLSLGTALASFDLSLGKALASFDLSLGMLPLPVLPPLLPPLLVLRVPPLASSLLPRLASSPVKTVAALDMSVAALMTVTECIQNGGMYLFNRLY